MSNSVKDRSTGPLLPKSERRALGKALAAKRAAQRRRRAVINRMTRISAPIVLVAALVGLTWWAIDSQSPNLPDPTASAAPSTEPSAPATTVLPAGADPALATKPEVVKPSGAVTALGVTKLITGTGAALTADQNVTANYVGVSYTTGEEFDSSWKSAGGTPLSFKLTAGPGGVIPGWVQGLVGVPIGSRVQLDIPVDLAYGEPTPEGFPGGALRFVVDVLGAS